MGKIKTHKASAKRFSVTGTGKVKINHCEHRHKLNGKTAKRKRNPQNPRAREEIEF